jgi:mRNA-degrading endonuclease HigB of HigAB toxin-antitoxin module
MLPLKERIENIKRKAEPERYIVQDTEILLYKLRQLDLPDLDSDDLKAYRKVLGKKKQEEKKEVKEQFTQLIEIFNIISSKIQDDKIRQITHYLYHFKEIYIQLEQEKTSKYSLMRLNQIVLPRIRPEMIRFISKYDELLKKEEDSDESYNPLGLEAKK